MLPSYTADVAVVPTSHRCNVPPSMETSTSNAASPAPPATSEPLQVTGKRGAETAGSGPTLDEGGAGRRGGEGGGGGWGGAQGAHNRRGVELILETEGVGDGLYGRDEVGVACAERAGEEGDGGSGAILERFEPGAGATRQRVAAHWPRRREGGG